MTNRSNNFLGTFHVFHTFILYNQRRNKKYSQLKKNKKLLHLEETYVLLDSAFEDITIIHVDNPYFLCRRYNCKIGIHIKDGEQNSQVFNLSFPVTYHTQKALFGFLPFSSSVPWGLNFSLCLLFCVIFLSQCQWQDNV